MNGSRLAETASTNSTLSGAMPISPAISLAISTSKPSGLPSRFLRPNSGWSNLVPTLTVPASLSLAMVVPSAKLAPELTWPPPSPPPLSSPPQAAAARVRASTAPASRRVRPTRMVVPPCLGGPAARSVADDLGEEVLGPLGPRVGEELLGWGGLQDPAAVHEHDPVGRRPGEAHLVADHDHGHAGGGQVAHDVEDLVDHLRVQGRGRLVEQQELGVHGQGAGDRHPLLLAARQLGRQLAGLVLDPDPGQQLAGPALGLLPGLAADLDRAQGDVVEHALVGEQVELLEDHADVGAEPGQGPALGGQGLALKADGAVVDRLEAVDGPAQGRLARAGGADHDHHLARVDLQVDVLEHVQVTEVLVDVLHLEQGGTCRHASGLPPVRT